MATYRKFGSVFLPNGHEHKTLKNISAGELAEAFNAAVFRLDAKKPKAQARTEQLVAQEFKRWQKVHKDHSDYITIDCDHLGDDMWVIQAFLTKMGQGALDTLNKGIVWNNERTCPDLQATVEFFEQKLSKGFISDETFGLISNLAREYAEMRPLKARIVYLRMKNSLMAGVKRKPPVAA